MFRVDFEIGSFEVLTQEKVMESISVFLEALIAVNLLRMKKEPVPELYRSRVRYLDDGGRAWRDVMEVIRHGEGNCQSLAAWRIAELRKKGEEARVHVFMMSNPLRFHIAVRRADGKIEDPSRKVPFHLSLPSLGEG